MPRHMYIALLHCNAAAVATIPHFIDTCDLTPPPVDANGLLLLSPSPNYTSYGTLLSQAAAFAFAFVKEVQAK